MEKKRSKQKRTQRGGSYKSLWVHFKKNDSVGCDKVVKWLVRRAAK